MKQKFLIAIITVFCNVNVNAQLFEKLGNKALEATERVLERKTEEKVEKATEETVDAVFEAPKKAKKERNSKKEDSDSKTDFPGTIPSGEANYNTKYIFPVTATIVVEDINADVQKITMKQGYGKEALITEMEANGDPFIIDMKNQSAIILDIKNGTAQIMSLEWMEKMMGNESISSDEEADMVSSVEKTGKIKVMNGYTCYEYNITYEEGRINAWYAPDVKFDYQDYLRGMAKMFSKKAEENPSQLLNTEYGYVMEMTAFNKQNKKQSAMKVIKLDEKIRMINMDLFKTQKL
ncbi:hypothetical protein [Xanthomarina gelatinilytica]|jgi:hypothetical protein|uniref:hypothetical protein n=1 Tax=Xanthomarina gelatinilytica TaxID=1137281 RepID=UPI003AA8C74B